VETSSGNGKQLNQEHQEVKSGDSKSSENKKPEGKRPEGK